LETGKLERIVDCSALARIAGMRRESVLNGVAHNPQNASLFVTGKYWNRIFELDIPR
jgi:glutamine cyclotransferase